MLILVAMFPIVYMIFIDILGYSRQNMDCSICIMCWTILLIHFVMVRSNFRFNMAIKDLHQEQDRPSKFLNTVSCFYGVFKYV